MNQGFLLRLITIFFLAGTEIFLISILLNLGIWRGVFETFTTADPDIWPSFYVTYKVAFLSFMTFIDFDSSFCPLSAGNDLCLAEVGISDMSGANLLF